MTTSAQVGKNEALFRAVNDRIRDVSGGTAPDAAVEFICECSRRDCTAGVPLTLAEYARVRTEPTWFAVAPGHLWEDDVEHVVAKHEAYWVLEKDGAAGDVAEATA